jgi:hypothetical protein
MIVLFTCYFVIMCGDGDKVGEALSLARKWAKKNGLDSHPDKIRVGDCKAMGEGLDFKGYRLEAWKGRVRKKSQPRLGDCARQLTKRANAKSLPYIIGKINTVPRGWHGYFEGADLSCLNPMDGSIRRRMGAILAKRSKRHKSFGRSRAIHIRWPDAFFRGEGHIPLAERAKAAKANRLF